MHTLNFIVRRIFAYPAWVVAVILLEVGGLLIRFSAWCIDFDVTRETEGA